MRGDTFYRNSLQAIEAELHGILATIELDHLRARPNIQPPSSGIPASRSYAFKIWTGQQLTDPLIALDTETAVIQDREIPKLALVQVCGDAGSCYFIHPDRLAQFVQQHSHIHITAHNAVFDFWVIAQHLQQHPDALAAWWDIPADGRLCCTMLLDQLICLARIDTNPVNRALDVLARDYCGLKLDKDDPYRMRYQELMGVLESAWPDQEPGFWRYAAIDAVATLHIIRAQARIAQDLIAPYRDQLLPDAERRYGPLTACLQVQGAIALDYASRIGIYVDCQMARQLKEDIGSVVEHEAQEMERLAGGPLFKRYKRTGELRRTRNGVPQRDSKACKSHLESVAKAAAEPIRPPRVKNGTITDAASFWNEYADADPFIASYCRFIEQSKLKQFFAALQTEQVHPRYKPLVRTGRTSCSDPNLQQLPRDGRFRAMIQAPPGYQLLQIDYSVLELRTLAAICLKRYGKSKLAELFGAGVDCHKYTAAQLLGLTDQQFAELPKDQQKQFRQRAKACFHPDVELLTELGWKRVADLVATDKVAQFWPESGLVEFAKPLQLTYREDQPLVRVTNEAIDLRVTPDHRMLGYRPSGHPAVVFPHQMNKMLRGIWSAGTKRQGLRLGALDEQAVRQIVCIQADGSVTRSGRQVRFGFTKLRKIQRIQQLFPSCQECANGGVATGFRVGWQPVYDLLLTKEKQFRTDRLLQLPARLRQAFLDELQHWDSHIRRGQKSFSYSTISKNNADAVSAVCAVTGYKASSRAIPRHIEKHNTLYVVAVKKRARTRSGTFQVAELEGRHRVYCLSMPSSFVIARDNGKTVCVGQCNFGVPGGLGAKSLVAYAKAAYGVTMSFDNAQKFRKRVINEVYPELRSYLHESTYAHLAQNLQCSESEAQAMLRDPERVRIAWSVVAGESHTQRGEVIEPDLAEYIWEVLRRLSCNPDLNDALAAEKPSLELSRRVFWGPAVTLTGRIRGHVGFTQRTNSPFQGLAADGNKLALFDCYCLAMPCAASCMMRCWC
jgi:hypothetical protein